MKKLTLFLFYFSCFQCVFGNGFDFDENLTVVTYLKKEWKKTENSIYKIPEGYSLDKKEELLNLYYTQQATEYIRACFSTMYFLEGYMYSISNMKKDLNFFETFEVFMIRIKSSIDRDFKILGYKIHNGLLKSDDKEFQQLIKDTLPLIDKSIYAIDVISQEIKSEIYTFKKQN